MTCTPATREMPGTSIEGHEKDLLHFHHDGKVVHQDNIRDGKNLTCNVTITTYTFEGDVPFEHSVGDLVTSKAAIAIRHGNHRDLGRFYGILRDDTGKAIGLRPINFYPRDGRDAAVYVHHNGGIVFVYGRKHDLKIRFCFDGTSWTHTGDARAAQIDGPCDKPFVAGGPFSKLPDVTW